MLGLASSEGLGRACGENAQGILRIRRIVKDSPLSRFTAGTDDPGLVIGCGTKKLGFAPAERNHQSHFLGPNFNQIKGCA